MKVRVWRYLVAADVRAEFEHEYGPQGSWARLFASSPGFLDTSLYAEVDRPGIYVTVDRFRTAADWEVFRAEQDVAYTETGNRLSHLILEQDELV